MYIIYSYIYKSYIGYRFYSGTENYYSRDFTYIRVISGKGVYYWILGFLFVNGEFGVNLKIL